MKIILKKLIIFSLFFLSYSMNAQSVRDIFNSKFTMITFMGLDFSKANMIGSDFSNPQQIKEQYFKEWNEILMAETKYDLKNPLRKANINFDFSITAKRNSAVLPEKMVVYDPAFLTLDNIISMVKDYDCGSKTGIGLTFIVNLFDRTKEKSVVHVVFFDMASKNILLLQTMRGEPGGNGIRNYWANSIANIISSIESTFYKQWEMIYFK